MYIFNSHIITSDYNAVYPPSTVNTPPVTKEEASEARYNAIPSSSSGVTGLPIALEHGITESNEPEAELKKIMLKNSKVNLLLVDHTKFDKAAFLKLFDRNDIDVLVTDKKPSAEWIERLKIDNVQLIY